MYRSNLAAKQDPEINNLAVSVAKPTNILIQVINDVICDTIDSWTRSVAIQVIILFVY